MKFIFFNIILFFLFFITLLVSSHFNPNNKSKRILIITGVVLYILSRLSSCLESRLFPYRTGVVYSEDENRALRISDSGKIETAIVKPVVEIINVKIKDQRNHEQFNKQKYPYLYSLYFSFNVINGIENKRPLLLKEITVHFYFNNSTRELTQKFKYNERIEIADSKNIDTKDWLFIGYTEKIDNCRMKIICKFSNFQDIVSQTTDVLIN